MMTQTRIVLRSKDAPTIEQIMSVTGVDSASDVISMLISRYGQALVKWWSADPHQCRLEPQQQLGEAVHLIKADETTDLIDADLPPLEF